MDNSMTVELLVSTLSSALKLNKTQIARLVKINESSISNNLGKTVEEIKTKKTGKRLLPLSLVVFTLLKNHDYSVQAIIEGLNEPVIPNIVTDQHESVIQAITTESLTNSSMLIEKALDGVKSYLRKREAVPDDVLSAVRNAIA